MSLSDRIRPNSEAAPWVVEEIKKLEAELNKARSQFSNHPRNSRRFFIATKVAKDQWVAGEEFSSVESVRNRIKLLHDERRLKEDDFLPVEITTVYHPAFIPEVVIQEIHTEDGMDGIITDVVGYVEYSGKKDYVEFSLSGDMLIHNINTSLVHPDYVGHLFKNGKKIAAKVGRPITFRVVGDHTPPSDAIATKGVGERVFYTFNP